MTSAHGWHELLVSVAAVALVATGLPILLLSLRAWTRRPRRPLHRPVGDARGALAAYAATATAAGVPALASLAARADLAAAVGISVAAAILAAATVHLARRARLGPATGTPLLGIAGIVLLIVIARGTSPHEHVDGHAALMPVPRAQLHEEIEAVETAGEHARHTVYELKRP